MRDPDRIPKVLSEIEEIWKKYPDLRLGQLLIHATSVMDINMFYVEDEELIRLLKLEFFEKSRK